MSHDRSQRIKALRRRCRAFGPCDLRIGNHGLILPFKRMLPDGYFWIYV